eukprot:814571_1
MASWIITIVFILFSNTVQTETVNCSGRCHCSLDGPCELRCIGDRICDGEEGDRTLTCRRGYPCTVICDAQNGQEACEDVIVDTNGATSMNLQCKGEQACQRVDLVCNDVDVCDITCYPGTQTCDQMDLDCATSVCNLDCAGSSSCNAVSVTTTDAESFECTNSCSSHDNIPPPKTAIPTAIPTLLPSYRPSVYPTRYPSQNPSSYPIKTLTNNPSNHPFASPTFYPTGATYDPSETPTNYPSKHPFVSPTFHPTGATYDPSEAPTNYPSNHPSVSPTFHPTDATYDPTKLPSIQPTVTPTYNEAEVVIETPVQENVGTTEGIESDEVRKGQIENIYWLYIAIGAAFCCILILAMVIMRCKRKNRTKKVTVDQKYMDSVALPLPASSPTERQAHVVLEHGTKTNKVELQSGAFFQESLANNVIAGDLVMDDIVSDMVATPGNMDMEKEVESTQSEHSEMNIMEDLRTPIGDGNEDDMCVMDGVILTPECDDNDSDMDIMDDIVTPQYN